MRTLKGTRDHLHRSIIMAAVCLAIAPIGAIVGAAEATDQAASTWKLGAPVVTYWAGPALTDAVARQMADGGFNLVCCWSEEQMDIAHKHGLRAQFGSSLISLKSLDDPAQRQKLDALVARVRTHPALYSYFIMDEPSDSGIPDCGRLVAYIRKLDPEHLAYVNLLPVYAKKHYFSTEGDPVTVYREHIRKFIDSVKPSLLSYDHYQFAAAGDGELYFLNLAMIRRAAQRIGVPFMNIVQAASWKWTPEMRVPNGDEMRYLVYTTLAYGAQGISYYVYCSRGHAGGIALPDGTPTPIYHALKSLNREFVAIATELQPLRSLEIYHAGMTPPATVPLPEDARFRLDPPVAPMPCENLTSGETPSSNNGRIMKPVKGIALGYFGPIAQAEKPAQPTHVLVVNLDYQAEKTTTLIGPEKLEVFDAAARRWSPAGTNRATLRLPPGGGILVREARH